MSTLFSFHLEMTNPPWMVSIKLVTSSTLILHIKDRHSSFGKDIEEVDIIALF